MAAGSIVARAAALGVPAACVTAVTQCAAELGQLDILGNIAGVYLAEHATNVTGEYYRQVMAENLDAYFVLAEAAISHLLDSPEHRQHRIERRSTGRVLLSRLLHKQRQSSPAHRVLAVEYLQTSLRVNAIAPAGTNTNTNIASSTTLASDKDSDLATRVAG